jgi:predicted nucleic acid-binding protein
MAIYFFDSSAVVKRYVDEGGTRWIQNIADPGAGNIVYLAHIAIVEVTSAVARRRRSGTISPTDAASILTQFQLDIAAEYRIIEITPTLLEAATALAETHALRAYDAVQLAAISDLHARRTTAGLPAITFISADQELNAAAKALGLSVDDPNSHP